MVILIKIFIKINIKDNHQSSDWLVGNILLPLHINITKLYTEHQYQFILRRYDEYKANVKADQLADKPSELSTTIPSKH